MRKDILSIAVVGIALAGIVVYTGTRPAPALSPATRATTPARVSLPAGAYTEQTQSYAIAANYPTTTPLAHGANEAAITQMQNYIGDTIFQFKAGGNSSNSAAGAK